MAIALFLADLDTFALVLAAWLGTVRGRSGQTESRDQVEVHGSTHWRSKGRNPRAVTASVLAAIAEAQAVGFASPLARQTSHKHRTS